MVPVDWGAADYPFFPTTAIGSLYSIHPLVIIMATPVSCSHTQDVISISRTKELRRPFSARPHNLPFRNLQSPSICFPSQQRPVWRPVGCVPDSSWGPVASPTSQDLHLCYYSSLSSRPICSTSPPCPPPPWPHIMVPEGGRKYSVPEAYPEYAQHDDKTSSGSKTSLCAHGEASSFPGPNSNARLQSRTAIFLSGSQQLGRIGLGAVVFRPLVLYQLTVCSWPKTPQKQGFGKGRHLHILARWFGQHLSHMPMALRLQCARLCSPD